MKVSRALLNPVFAAILLLTQPVLADSKHLDDLFAQLQTTDDAGAEAIAQQIWAEWSKTGSASMDLLLQRGNDAMNAGDLDTAIGHFTALIDHDPDFAEGWNARATAFYNAGQIGPAINDIQHTLALNPRHFGALAGLGMIFEDLDEPDKALEVYKAALAINPHMKDVQDAVKRLETAKGQDL